MLKSLLILPLLAILFAGQAGADCAAIARQAEEAPLQHLQTLHQEALQTLDCSPDFQAYLGRQIARAYARQVQDESKHNPKADVFDTLQQSLRYARLWQALAMLGDVYHERRDFYQATIHYQEALDIIADTDKTPTSPAPNTIEEVFKKAERSRLLAAAYVPAPVNRDGKPSGLAATDIRGWTVEEVAIPITFEFDSTTFDAKGKAAAADMLEYLTKQGSAAITVIGHTDPRGSDPYNLDLSQRRAEAVKQFLLDQGYRGSIRTEGRGKREPPELDDALAYSQDEIYRLHRRVELQRR